MPVSKICIRCSNSYVCSPSKSIERKYCSYECARLSKFKYQDSTLPLWKSYEMAWMQNKGMEHVRKTQRKQFLNFYDTPHGRAIHMLNNAKARAKRLSIECTLTPEWIKERLTHCEVTKIPLILESGNGKGHNVNSFSPSIDRIDQHGPYTPENCRITCWIYNRARGAFPPADFDTMITALLSLQLPS